MISSPGCRCLGNATPGSRSTRTWMTSRPGTLRSCRWRSVRLTPGCCAGVTCSIKPLATISTATAMIRVGFMWILLMQTAARRWQVQHIPELRRCPRSSVDPLRCRVRAAEGFSSSRRRLPELEHSLGQFVRAFLRQKVAAPGVGASGAGPRPAGDRASLHAVSEGGNSGAKRVAHPVGSPERQDGHGQSLGRARLRLRQALLVKVCPVPGKTSAHGSGRGILARIFVESRRIYSVGSGALRREDPGKEFSLASLDKYLRQIVQPVERKLPALEIRRLARKPTRECSHSGNVRLRQYQSSDVGWIIRGVGVRDPRPDVMGDDVDSSRCCEVGRFEETMQVACGSIEIVTPGWLVALAKTSRIEHDDAAACADQQR